MDRSMEIKRASIWGVFLLAKVKALKEPTQYWGPKLNPVEG
jgi:hypothetical protein